MSFITYIATPTAVYSESTDADIAGPTYHAAYPTGTYVKITNAVRVSIRDDSGSGVDFASIDVDIAGDAAIIGGAFQTGYTGTITANSYSGYDLLIRHIAPFTNDTLITVEVSADDLGGNNSTYSWSFTTLRSLVALSRYLIVGNGGIIREFDPTTLTFSADKTTGTTENLKCVSADPYGRHIYVGGLNGTLLHSADGGETWLFVSGFTNEIKAVKVIASDEVYVFEYSTSSCKLHKFNGSAWSVISSTGRIEGRYLWGEHNNIFLGFNYGAYNDYSLKHWDGTDYVTDVIVPSTEVDVYNGTIVGDEGASFLWCKNAGTYPPIEIYRGSFGSWTLDHTITDDVTGNFLDQGDYLVYDEASASLFLKIDDPLDSRFYIYKRSAVGTWSTLGPASFEAWGGLAVRSESDLCVAVAASGRANKVVHYDGLAFTEYTCSNPTSGWHNAILALPPADSAPPTFEGESPTGVDAPKATTIYVSIRDVGGSGVDLTTIDATVDGVDAIIAGVPQTGFTSSTVLANAFNGYDVTITSDTDYASFADIDVAIFAADIAGNSESTSWSFRIEDYLGVLVVPISPTDGQENINTRANISLELEDEQDIALSSITIEIDLTGTGLSYVTAFASEAFTSGWDGPASAYNASNPKDVLITIDPILPFPADTEILVRVSANDQAGNPIRM